jgi:hypothetical protein
MSSTIDFNAPAPPPDFAFCESVAAGGTSPWHIRRVTPSIGLKLGGNIDTSSLCGHPSKGWGWDLSTRITERALAEYACTLCLAAYRLGPAALLTVVDVLPIKKRGLLVCFEKPATPIVVGTVLTRGRLRWSVTGVESFAVGSPNPTGAVIVAPLAVGGLPVGHKGHVPAWDADPRSMPRVGDTLARHGLVAASVGPAARPD